MLRVIDVAYIKDYELLLKFNDGVVKKVDLLPYLTGIFLVNWSISINLFSMD